ncbi:hypothetical protein KR044_004854, partial [Drosophila immigrans]
RIQSETSRSGQQTKKRKENQKSQHSEDRVLLSRLPLELEVCAFCLDAKRDPVLLRCRHSFCRSCLNLFCQARNWPAKRCPLCRSNLEPLQQQINYCLQNWRLFLLVILAFCVLSIGPFYLLLTYW